MKITANDLKNLKIIDKIINEPEGGAQKDLKKVAQEVKKYIINEISDLLQLSTQELVNNRYEKFRKM